MQQPGPARHVWQQVLLTDGPHRAAVHAVLLLDTDGRPVGAWLPWWQTWSVERGALPVGLS